MAERLGHRDRCQAHDLFDPGDGPMAQARPAKRLGRVEREQAQIAGLGAQIVHPVLGDQVVAVHLHLDRPEVRFHEPPRGADDGVQLLLAFRHAIPSRSCLYATIWAARRN